MHGLKNTSHASQRMAARCITDRAVDAVMTFGKCFWAGRGCLAWHLGRRAVRRAMRQRKVRIDEYQNMAVIVSHDGTLVTVEHCARPPRHWKPA
jgi:hypothetical protein